jgi:hypothetical protein
MFTDMQQHDSSHDEKAAMPDIELSVTPAAPVFHA